MTAFEIWGLVLLVVSSFAATNTDNLILLVILMGARPQQRAGHALGFLTSALAVLVLAALAAVVGTQVDPALLGYLGFIPLGLGVYLLWQRLGTSRGEHSDESMPNGRGSGWLSTTALMFSNSADSLAVFVPLLAESDRDSLLWEVSVFLVMAILWAALAWRIADQPRFARRIEALGERLVPWILILVGVYILLDTATDTLV